jgi:predicted small secreted protein
MEGEKEASMKSLKEKIVMVLLVVLLFCAGLVSGCMTARGFCSDMGDLCRAGEHYLDPMDQARHPSR